MTPWLNRFIDDRSGATSIEYGLIAFFMSIALVYGATRIGQTLYSNYYAPISAGLK